MDGRARLAIVLTAVAVLALTGGPGGDSRPPADVAVVIDGPDGRFWQGNHTADPGHAFGALLAAAEAGHFTVDWTGTGDRVFVRGINGWSAAGSSGWCIQVDDGTGYRDTPRGAAATLLEDGWSVRWYWVNDGCDQF